MADTLAINKHKNILIIGKAATSYARKEIAYINDYDEAYSLYGSSDLMDALKVAWDFGAPDIFVMNLQEPKDYFEMIDIVQQSDFAYVVLSSVLLSDTFQDNFHGGEIHSLIAYLMGKMGLNSNTTFIVTDKHASLYEDIDAYLKDMRNVQEEFLARCSGRANLRNVVFIANNLESYKRADIVLGSMLASTDPWEYPISSYYGKVVFRIDQWDNPGDMAYFRENYLRETTIENLLNMDRENDPEKVVFIDRIAKYILRELDFSEFKGRLYTEYQKLLFSQKLNQELRQMVGTAIKEFEVKTITAEKDVDNPGTVIMTASVNVLPVNCFEVCTIKKEVEV